MPCSSTTPVVAEKERAASARRTMTIHRHRQLPRPRADSTIPAPVPASAPCQTPTTMVRLRIRRRPKALGWNACCALPAGMDPLQSHATLHRCLEGLADPRGNRVPQAPARCDLTGQSVFGGRSIQAGRRIGRDGQTTGGPGRASAAKGLLRRPKGSAGCVCPA